jgi:hypothetical protein
MKPQFTQSEVIELTTAILKSITERVNLSPAEMDDTIDTVSKAVVKGLQMAGVELPWVHIRKN